MTIHVKAEPPRIAVLRKPGQGRPEADARDETSAETSSNPAAPSRSGRRTSVRASDCDAVFWYWAAGSRD